jgi:hypothetical protein
MIIEFNQIVSTVLDANKHWYALNSELCGIGPGKFVNYSVFKISNEDVKRVNIKELATANGDRVPAKWFLSSLSSTSKNRVDDVFVASSFGVFAGVVSTCKNDKMDTLCSLCWLVKAINDHRLDTGYS